MMTKRKMGFGLANLKPFSKSSASIKAPIGPIFDWPEDEDDEYISTADTQFISRPPKLDARTEHELRKACALILRDLKPSGYDVEDTRMKSDILVDDPAEQRRYFQQQEAQAKQQQQLQSRNQVQHQHRSNLSAPWSLGAGEDQSSSFVDSRTIRREMERHRQQTTTLPDVKYTRSDTQAATTSKHPNPLKSQPTNHFSTSESPLAPKPTMAVASPVRSNGVTSTHSAAADRPITSRRVDSSSTVSSIQYPASTFDTKSISTSATSAHFTPSSSSKRVSENANDIVSAPDGNTKEWMKEEVNKRRRAQTDVPNHDHAAPTLSSAPAKKTWALFSSSSPVNRETSHEAMAQSVGNIFISRPKSREGLGNARIAEKQAEMLSDNTLPAQEARPVSSGSSVAKISTSNTPVTKITLVRPARTLDPALDPPQSPRFKGEDIPPVPSLDGFRESAAAINGDPARSPSLLSSITRALPGHEDQVSAPDDARPFATRSAVGRVASSHRLAGESMASTANTHNATSIFASTQNGSTDEPQPSALREFYKSSFAPTMRQPPPTADPEAADFDFLMGFMKDTKEPDFIFRREENSLQNLTTAKQITSSHEEDKSARSATKATQPAMNGDRPPSLHTISSATHVIITSPSRAQATRNGGLDAPQIPPLSSRISSDRLSSSAQSTSTRNQYAASFRSQKTEPRGFKKLMKKLGGGDMPAQRNVFQPPNDLYRVYPEEQIREEDEDWDEEACAAPVVGFGRGW